MSAAPRHVIVDIGSNTIRLEVFGAGVGDVLYNDKLAAGLGRGVVAQGKLDKRAMDAALRELRRYAALIRLIRPTSVQVVATAAVRDAANGEQFLAAVRALGLPARLLSGEDEARASAIGVIATHGGAQGLVADLGGGSLELARIGDDRVAQCTSFRLGVLPVAAIRAGGRGLLRAALKERLRDHPWAQMAPDETLYLVGGSWRALGKFEAARSGQNFTDPFPAAEARALKAAVREYGPRRLAALPGISSARAGQLDHAAALLAALIGETGAQTVQISTTGLREGLLLQQLST
ncbi:hypothetical protein [Novosphingobium sp.]|uniref:Ppx/GppA phosphatase family protein n=1 Tax=Novosphingobium sp. TaxID=1874826 RepID=UPI00286A9CDA|nr:hypothetical protein [Novosphingobium sp.]